MFDECRTRIHLRLQALILVSGLKLDGYLILFYILLTCLLVTSEQTHVLVIGVLGG